MQVMVFVTLVFCVSCLWLFSIGCELELEFFVGLNICVRGILDISEVKQMSTFLVARSLLCLLLI